VDPETRVGDALLEAKEKGLPDGRPLLFRRSDGTFGHVFPIHLRDKWEQLIDDISSMPIGKVPVGDSFTVDRYSDGAVAERTAIERDAARGIVIVLDDDRVAGIVVDPTKVRGIGDDFFAGSVLTELYGVSPTQSADVRGEIQGGRPSPCPHCNKRAKLMYDVDNDIFTCAECGQVLG
jgi:hypothetical protein